MKPCCSSIPFHAHVRHVVSRVFFAYGRVVARFPWLFILLPVVTLGALGAGLITMEQSDALDEIHMPRNSPAFVDQAKTQQLFPDRTKDHYDALELNEDQIMGTIIFKARDNASVYDDDVISEIRDVIAAVKENVTVENGTALLRYEDMCGRRSNVCVVTGERLLAPQFNAMRTMGILTYPKWKLPTTGDMVDLSFALADSDSELQRVGVVRVTFKLRHDLQPLVFDWEDAFIKFMKTLKTNRTDFVFSASSSISKETADDFLHDVNFVWLSLGIIAAVTWLVTWGSDVVSTRGLLVLIGLVSPALGVIGAMGLLCVCGVKVVEMVWVVPVLVLGIGTTDMSLLMTAWSRRLGREEEEEEEGDAQKRVGLCVADVGAQISVSSVSVSLAFCLAYLSPFPSVANFGLYAGVSVLLCYVSTMTLGVGCLAVHAYRVIASRHVVTCHVTRPRDQLRKEGKSLCTAVICGGSQPGEKYGDQSVLEKIPRLVLVKVTQNMAGKIVITVLYLGLLCASVYGVVNMKKGVELMTIISKTSYTHDYMTMDAEYFGFSFPVMFVMDDGVDYNNKTATLVSELLTTAKRDPGIAADFVRCWLTKFSQSSFYNRTTEGENFPGVVIEEFLLDTETYLGDVVLDANGERVVASRCYVFTHKNSDQNDLTSLMQRMRDLAAKARVKVFAYHPAFLTYDQRLAILPALLQASGVALVVLAGIYLLFFPQVLSGLLVLSSAISTLLGTLGLMSFLDIPFSFVSMTHVIFNTAFALYFSVQVAASYLQSRYSARPDRVADAVASAAAPLFNGAFCIGVGVLLFLTAASYSFFVLSRVTLLTLGVAVFHAVLFVPTILSLIGPEKSQEEADYDLAFEEALKQQTRTVARRDSRRNSRPKQNGEVIRTEPQRKDSHGPNRVSNWPHFTSSPPTDAHAIRNGRLAQQRANEKAGNQSIRSSILPVADYENAEEFQKSPPSNKHGHGLPPNGHYNTAPRMTAVANPYENWPPNKRSKKMVAAPFSKLSVQDKVHHRNTTTIAADHVNSGLGGSLGRRTVYLPNGVKKPTHNDTKQPKSPRQSRPVADMQTDIVASLDNMYAACPEPHQEDSVATLEDIHHVACTLSTSGNLGATQAYVVENFRDIPC